MKKHPRSIKIKAVAAGMVFGGILGLWPGSMAVLRWGIPWGILTWLLSTMGFGLAFGMMMVRFALKTSAAFKEHPIVFLDEETLIHDSPANHVYHKEAVGGWLYLTNKRLIFCSHQVNYQPHMFVLTVEQIVSSKNILTFGIIPNGLSIRTRAGCEERFVVENRTMWHREITRLQNESA